MKKQYFTANSIQALAQEWMNKYAILNKELMQPFQINKAALLLLDLQRYFLEPESHAFVPSGPVILENLNKISLAFRSCERPVIATQHINTKENAARMNEWWSDLLTSDHALVDLHPDLSVNPQDVLTKSQYDAFYGTDLSSRLEEQNVSQLVIGGVMTHLCCESTARTAFMNGYEVFFLVDGTATYHQGYHQATLRNLAHGFAILTTTEALLQGL